MGLSRKLSKHFYLAFSGVLGHLEAKRGRLAPARLPGRFSPQTPVHHLATHGVAGVVARVNYRQTILAATVFAGHLEANVAARHA